MSTTKKKSHPSRKRELESTRGQLGGRTGLTEQRLRFIDGYMTDRNAQRAARAAGYSDSYAETKSSQLLRVPAIAGEIDRRTLARISRLDFLVDEIVLELKRIATFDVRKLFDPATGKFLTNPYEMSEDDARGLVNFDICVLNKDGDYIVKLNPGNKLKALELCGRHLGLFSDRVEHSGGTTVNFVTDFGARADEPQTGGSRAAP